MEKATISRRGFVKGAAAAAAALTAAGSVQLLEPAEEAYAAGSVERVMHKTACHGCTNCCPVRVYTEEGRVVKIEGDPDGPLNKGGICLHFTIQIESRSHFLGNLSCFYHFVYYFVLGRTFR